MVSADLYSVFVSKNCPKNPYVININKTDPFFPKWAALLHQKWTSGRVHGRVVLADSKPQSGQNLSVSFPRRFSVNRNEVDLRKDGFPNFFDGIYVH